MCSFSNHSKLNVFCDSGHCNVQTLLSGNGKAIVLFYDTLQRLLNVSQYAGILCYAFWNVCAIMGRIMCSL